MIIRTTNLAKMHGIRIRNVKWVHSDHEKHSNKYPVYANLAAFVKIFLLKRMKIKRKNLGIKIGKLLLSHRST